MSITKKIASVFLCFVMALTTLIGSTFTTSAASDKLYYTGRKYYVVTTKANYWYPGSESITVSQAREVYYSNKKLTKTKSRNALVCTVKCTPISWSGSKTPKTITKVFTGSSKKIDLEKNVTYSVEISWKSTICAYRYDVKTKGYAYISGTHKAKIA